MKTYTANVDLFLIDGEIFITDNTDRSGADIKGFEYPVIYSTKYKNISGIIELDRSLFVNGVDLEDEITDAWANSRLISINAFAGFKEGFKAGYQANKAEFTREEMQTAISYASICTIAGHDLADIKRVFFENHRKLSLPKSLEIINDKITNITW